MAIAQRFYSKIFASAISVVGSSNKKYRPAFYPTAGRKTSSVTICHFIPIKLEGDRLTAA